ncbi:hypothetical protein HDK77DRAFT_212041 [Phyllosticta capitalensis]
MSPGAGSHLKPKLPLSKPLATTDQPLEVTMSSLSPHASTQEDSDSDSHSDPIKIGQSLWEDAMKRLNKDELSQLNSKEHGTPDKVVQELEAKKEQLGSEHKGAMDRVVGRIDAFYNMANAAMTFAPESIQIVWTVIGVLIKLTTSFKNFLGVIMNASDAISEAVFSCSVYISQCRIWSKEPVAKKARELTRDIYYNILVLSLELKKWTDKYQSGGRRRKVQNYLEIPIKAAFGKSEELAGYIEQVLEQLKKLHNVSNETNHRFVQRSFQELLEKMNERNLKTEQLAQSFALATKQAESHFEKLAFEVAQRIEKKMVLIEKLKKEQREYDTTLKWLQDGIILKTTEPEEQRQEKVDKMSDGTCKWILEEEKFKLWLKGDKKRVLWLVGRAGSGKSFLCSSIAGHLAQLEQADGRIPILILFYCRMGSDAKSEGKKIMRHLLVQLFQALEVLDEESSPDGLHNRARCTGIVVNKIKECRHRAAVELDVDTCANLLKDIVEVLSRRIFLVLDAVDECMDRGKSGILKSLLDLVQKAPNMRLLVSSRDEDDIRNLFHSEENAQIHRKIKAGKESTKKDIERFVEQELSSFGFITTDQKRLARDIVPKRSEGMFQYAAMALGTEGGSYRAEILLHFEDTIDNIPKGLNELYNQRLLKLGNPAQKLLKIILRWLACARYVELISVIDEFGEYYLKHDQPHEAGTPENEKQRAKSVMEVFYPHLRDFVRLEDGYKLEVKAQHASIIDWAKGPLGDHPHSPTRDISPQRGNFIMARNLMKTLTHPSFQKRYLSSSQADFTPRYELFCWDDHIRWAEEAFPNATDRETDEWDLLYQEIDNFIIEERNKSYFENWCKQYSSGRPNHPVFLAAQLGISGPFKRYFEIALQEGQTNILSQQDDEGLSPLHRACDDSCPYEMLKFILDKDVSQINVTGGRFQRQTPLYILLNGADYSKIHPHVKLLLKNGARAYIPDDRNGSTCLHLAVRRGGLEVFNEILQQDGVEVNAQDVWGYTPLFELIMWSESMDIRMARLLLNAGANVRLTMRDNTTLLLEAVKKKDTAFASMVIEEAPDLVDFAGTSQRTTPLHEAATRGNESLVKLLLDKGADVLPKDSLGLMPLQAALVQWQYNQRSGRSPTAHEAVVRMLLEWTSIDENSIDILISAIELDLSPICEHFAHLGHQLDRHGWSPLMLAENLKHTEIYQLLSDAQAKYDIEVPKVQSRPMQDPIPPDSWDRDTTNGRLAVSNDGLSLCGPEKQKEEFTCFVHSLFFRANHPIPATHRRFYFEVEIEELGESDQCYSIGFCTQFASADFCDPLGIDKHELPSWGYTSWGSAYQYSRKERVDVDLETYGRQDVVGAGIDFTAHEIFFTKNGVRFDVDFEKNGMAGRLFPAISLNTVSGKVTANFGAKPFKYLQGKDFQG